MTKLWQVGGDKMHNIFYKISSEEQEILSKMLEANIIKLKKNSTLSKIIYKNILGVVLNGAAQIVKIDYDGNKSIIEDLFPNMVFGSTISSLESEEISLMAKEDTSLIIFDYDRILNSEHIDCKCYMQFLKNILNITNDEITQKNIRIEIITKKTIRARLLAYFEVFSKNGKILLNTTYTELADYLAVDRCAMTRELKNLKEEGFIETHGKTILIKLS